MVSPNLFTSQLLGSILPPCSQYIAMSTCSAVLNLNLIKCWNEASVRQQIHFARWALDTVDAFNTQLLIGLQIYWVLPMFNAGTTKCQTTGRVHGLRVVLHRRTVDSEISEFLLMRRFLRPLENKNRHRGDTVVSSFYLGACKPTVYFCTFESSLRWVRTWLVIDGLE